MVLNYYAGGEFFTFDVVLLSFHTVWVDSGLVQCSMAWLLTAV